MAERSKLKLGSKGKNVAQLHAALDSVGVGVADEEREKRRFGDSTKVAVEQVQKLLGLEQSGEVSPEVLALALAAQERLAGAPPAGAQIEDGHGLITGTVIDGDGMPLPGAVVIAQRLGLREQSELGKAEADKEGNYRIEYRRELPATEKEGAEAGQGIDLQLQVLDADGKPSFSSAVAYDVPAQVEIQLPTGGSGATTPSEFHRGVAALSSRLGKVPLAALEENDEHRDLTFLSGDAELGTAQVALQTIAARLADSTKLPPELFYALFRQNVPPDASVRALAAGSEGVDLEGNAKRLLEAALRASPEVREQAVAAAISQDIVPPSYAERAPEDLKQLASLSIDAALDDSAGLGKTPVREILAAATVPEDKQRAFMELFKLTTKPLGSFWHELERQPQFSPDDIANLRFGIDVGRFTRGHMPLINAIAAMRAGGKIKQAADLARLSAEEWKGILESKEGGETVGIPANFTAASPELAVEAYARLLERNFTRAYPTTAFASRLAADRESPLGASAGVAEFLEANPGFDLRQTNVDRFLKDNPQALNGNREKVRASLLVGQRLIKVASRYEVAKPLLADGIVSAQQIYSMGKARFLQTYAEHPEIGKTEAARVFNQAEQTYAMSLSLVTKLHAAGREIDPFAVGGLRVGEGAPTTAPTEETDPPETPEPVEPGPGDPGVPAAPPAPKAADLDQFPNLQTLFGSLDLCACKQCRSVLSPAAYFADLMRFLSHRQSQGTTAKAALLERRPDLIQIELSCANTNTELPYIDLVNELLEDAVAPPTDPVAAVRARQTTLSTPELDANPQYVNDDAYVKLAEAVHPLPLPFDLPLLEVRTYLGQLGAERLQLMRALGKQAPLPDAAEAETMAIEALGLAAGEAEIITGTGAAAARSAWEFWGLAESGNTVLDPVDGSQVLSGSWIEILSHVRVLLDRIGLDHAGLTRVLNTRFVNPGGVVKLVNNPPDSCDLATMTVAGLDTEALQRLHRFVRLQRRLGWDPYDLDAAITRLQAGVGPGLAQLNATLLRQLRALTWAMARFRIPAPSALALFTGIDTYQPPSLPGDAAPNRSLYATLFQNVSVLNPGDPAFALDLAGDEIAGPAPQPPLAEHHEMLVAALQLSDVELSEAIAGLTDGKLTLANVSLLYRWTLLGRGLGIAMKDLLSLRALVEIETDAPPAFVAVDPFDPARPELLEFFCEEVAAVRSSRFEVPQLDYLLRGEGSVGVGPDDVTVGTLIKAIRDGLIKLAAESPAGTDLTAAASGLVAQQLAEALNLPSATAAQLLGSWFRAAADPGKPLVEDFLSLPHIVRDPALENTPVGREEAGFGTYFAAYAALDKAAQTIAGFGFDAAETQWLQDHGVGAGWLDPTRLPATATATPEGRFVAWHRLAEAVKLRAGLPPAPEPFTALLDLAAGAATKAEFMTALSARTGWSADDLKALAGDSAQPAEGGSLGLAYPDDYRSERGLAALLAAFAQLHRLGASAQSAVEWTGATVSAPQATAVKQSVKAKYPSDRWLEIAKPLRDVLREAQRDALVAFLLVTPPPGVGRWHDADDVYGHYLIDVEMGACQETSRIVQANAAIQLFVQRCILNLEHDKVVVDAKVDGDWLQWKWMSRYQLWKANREVFLYPENWIEPGLRSNKSPFFQELENELLQNEVTSENAEDAFRVYLEKLDGVARLDVVGTYFEAGTPTRLHVFGRKQGNPPTHYHREWIDSFRWTAWTKVELDIVSQQLLPIVWNRRLYLFWAIVNRRPNRAQTMPTMALTGSVPPDPGLHLEVQLAWSEFKDGKWQAKQTAPQTLVLAGDSDPFQVTLKSSQSGDLLRIDVFADRSGNREHQAEFVLGGIGNSVEAYASGATGLLGADPDARGIGELDASLQKGILGVPPDSAYEDMAIVPTSAQSLGGARPRVSALNTSWLLYNALNSEAVLKTADRYRLFVPHQALQFDSSLPFFFSDSQRSYFVIPRMATKAGYYVPVTHPTGSTSTELVYRPLYTFRPNYHGFVPLFVKELNAGGLDRLFDRRLQAEPATIQGTAFDFNGYYQPTVVVDGPYPTEGVDFEHDAPYSIYNWELFYHAPFQIGESLSANQRFEEAKHWYEYVFDPTSASAEPAPQRYWVTKPFREMTAANYREEEIESLMAAINAHDPGALQQVNEWRANPFDPHAVAELRPVAYQRAIVMKYIDNLVAWGDQLFRQDTMESINEATQLYVLAAELLGPRPELVQPATEPAAMTFAELEPKLDEFADSPIAAAENALPPTGSGPPVPAGTAPLPALPPLYFCTPPNEQLIGYWDTVADRLFKVRHCMNIEGEVRKLALFAPPIDPGMLVKATAAGLDLGSVMNELEASPPPYRFRVMVREALQLAEFVRGIGAELLAALEKRDAEALARTRSKAEAELHAKMLESREKAIAEVEAQGAVLVANRAVADERVSYLAERKDDLANAWEILSLSLTGASGVAQAIAVGLETASGAAHVAPEAQFGASGAGGSPHVSAKIGGPNVGRGADSWAKAMKITAGALQTAAAMSGVMGSNQRRMEDWAHQYALALKEVEVLEAQKAALAVHQEIVEKERDTEQLAKQLADDTDVFLHEKFTNQELYEWMLQQIGTTYFQAYGLAYSVAKQAELCLRRELGLKESSYIQFGYWDSLKKGLLAGDKLSFDVQRLESAYLTQNERELELSKHASLRQLDPTALAELRSSGECLVTLPELWFDIENPGHYMRRLKSVAITVPSVVGPYANVSLTATLLQNQVRTDPDSAAPYARAVGEDARFADDPGGAAIVTSSAQEDSGLFETNLQDERYLPFEDRGAVGTWKLKLNAVYPQFDYRTISDVVMHLRYTARDAGEPLATAAAESVRTELNQVALGENRHGLYRLLNPRQELSAEWGAFLEPGAGDQALSFDLRPDDFPFFTGGLDLKVTELDVFAKLSDPGDYVLEIARAGAAAQTVQLHVDPELGGVHHGATGALAPKADLGKAPAAQPHLWSLKLKRSGAADFRSLTAAEVEDLVLVLGYEASP